MMSKPVTPFLILDECLIPLSETLWLTRMRRSFFSYRGWQIAEKFDDRYDTEVGGMQSVVMQWVERGDAPIESNNIRDLDIRQSRKVIERAPTIHDYITGDVFSLAEAEERPELKPVTERLKQRMTEYELFLSKLPDSVTGIGYTDEHAEAMRLEGKKSEH